VGAAAAVLLVHLGLLGALFFASTLGTGVHNPYREIELTFRIPMRTGLPPALPPALRPNFIAPKNPLLPARPGQLSVPLAQPGPASPDTISGVGRALFGCDPKTLDLLPAKDRAGCLHLPQSTASAPNLRMPSPPGPNSPFTKEIEERFRQAIPINRPCPLGSFNDTRGLPCFGFQGDEASPIYPRK